MKKWLAAGLLSVPLMSNPAPLFAQTPATPAVVTTADQVVYQPADEGWSIRTPKDWTTASAAADPEHFPNTVFARATRHQLSSGGEMKVEMVAVRFKLADPLTAAQKAVFVQGAVAEVEKKFGTVKKTKHEPTALGLPTSCVAEDWDVEVGSGGQFQIRLTYRVIVADHTAYMIIAGGEGGVAAPVRKVLDSFRIEHQEGPRANRPAAVIADPSELVVRPVSELKVRSAPGPAATAPTLPALFESLGYTAKNVGTEAEPIYELRFRRDGWNYVLKCQLSTDKRVLWLFSNVGGEGVDPSRLSPSAVLTLLGENDKDRLAYFSFNAERKQFCLNTGIDPKRLSADTLRERIDLLTAVIKETQPAWDALGQSKSK